MDVFVYAYLLGLALILPIGAQNLYLINLGLKIDLKHAYLGALAATLCDSALITIGALGVGLALKQYPLLIKIMMLGGGLFLLFLSISLFISTKKSTQNAQQRTTSKMTKIIGTTIAVSWLNPHAILDTVVVIGSSSLQFPNNKILFIVGACSASFCWFTFLVIGSSITRRILTDRLWLYINYFCATLMAIFGIKLLFNLAN